MVTDDGRGSERHQPDTSSFETESVGSDRVPYSGPLSGPLNKRGTRKSARFDLPGASAKDSADDDYVEITLDVRDDSVAVHSVKPAGGGAGGGPDDPEVTLLAKTLERRSASFGSAAIRSASSRIRQVSQELKRLASITRRPGAGVAGAGGRVDRTKSAAAHALKGLKFISKTDGSNGWPAVEKRFDDLAVDGKLPRALFCQCIGTSTNSTVDSGALSLLFYSHPIPSPPLPSPPIIYDLSI